MLAIFRKHTDGFVCNAAIFKIEFFYPLPVPKALPPLYRCRCSSYTAPKALLALF